MKYIDSKIENVSTGERVTIVRPCNLYECSLSDDVFVGPFVEIQSNVEVGSGTRIQSHSFICSLVTIGKDCFIGHGVMFINDKFSSGTPAQGDTSKWLSTYIGNKVSIGSNCTILPVNICDDVVIGAGSVVTKDIKISGSTTFTNTNDTEDHALVLGAADDFMLDGSDLTYTGSNLALGAGGSDTDTMYLVNTTITTGGNLAAGTLGTLNVSSANFNVGNGGVNSDPDSGRTGSIKCGLTALRWPKRAIVAPVDRPGFSSQTLRRLIDSEVCTCPSIFVDSVGV